MPGEVSTREYRNSDGTFTVQSDYILVPSRETHKETLTCVTSYNEEVFTDSVTLDIQCKSAKTKCQKNRIRKTKQHKLLSGFSFCLFFLVLMFSHQTNQKSQWRGLMETGTSTERTSS